MSKIKGERDFIPISIAVLTVSDSRNLENDKSGKTLVERIEGAGHIVAARDIVTDEVARIVAKLREWIGCAGIDAVISTGGTGKALAEAGIEITQIQEITGNEKDDYFSGRMKTISFNYESALLYIRDDEQHVADCDVLVSGNDPKAREVVVQLAGAMGMRAWHAGAIDNSAVAEALTSVLIFLNKRYKIDGAGIRITGVPGSAGGV